MTATVIYMYRSERFTRVVHSLSDLEEILIWIERHGAKLIEVKGEDFNA